MDTISPRNSYTVTLAGLVDSDGLPIQAASVQATLLDAGGVQVPGQSWPLTMQHDSNGSYDAILPKNAEINAGQHYVLRFEAAIGSADRAWDHPIVGE